MAEFPLVALGGLAARNPNAMATGPFGSSIGSKTFRAVGVPVIRGSNLSADVGKRLVEDDFVFIEPELATRFVRSQVGTGDLVFTCWGTINQVGIIDESAHYDRYVISNKQMKFTADIAKVLPLFLYYWFSSPEGQAHILGGAIGSSVPGFNLGQLRQMRVPLPTLDEQGAITSILGALDDKIDINRRMNETLEATARAFFKDWFVEFGPTRAKIEGRSPYLASEIWSLFPDRLDNDGKPQGWEDKTLREATEVITRGISPSYVAEGGVLVLNQKCIRDRRVDGSKARRHNPSVKSLEGRNLTVGDILVNSTGVGTLGRVAQAWELPEQCTVVDSHITVVRTKGAVLSPYYLGFDLTGRETEIEALGEGSTGQTELARARLGALPILVPQKLIQAAFDSIVRPLIELMVKNDLESESLAVTRDLLLPKLMSGEIRVKDAEKIAEAAK